MVRDDEMKPVVDPEGVEVSHFITACQPEGKKILEIGCGPGTLTFQYAKLPALVIGIDPSESELKLANNDDRSSQVKVDFTVAKAESQPFPPHIFDIVVFASSL
jgi:ubiquinone/menaquinone biosynthesis C-methylase UbiE